ncbi:MAG TPA: A/G-specific adenine glycosylase [Bryobacteraceae bacterium]|nr:A/G-specific adenine glycosylase [Bryobacteraceae bacterium]
MRRRGARNFAARLLAWYARQQRDLPWRRTRDPYRIWVSEIMLQQTRAQAVIPYYERFLSRFPTVAALAEAAESDVLAAWSGLGYYSRARNLQKAARAIVAAGGFPRDYEALRRLPGIGPYTAAAIASIAFGQPHAVLDGNVLRVLARLENDPADIASSRTRARFQQMAGRLLEPKDPAAFNQAMMELGATVCLPRAPRCLLCPVAQDCRALAAGTAEQLPVKLRPGRQERIEQTLVRVEKRGRLLLRQRPADAGRMAGFWELPAVEDLPGVRLNGALGSFRHTITRHLYVFTVRSGTLARAPRGFRWLSGAELGALPLSTAARKALRLGNFPQGFVPKL